MAPSDNDFDTPGLRKRKQGPSGIKNPHTCTVTYAEVSSWGDSVPGEAVTSTQSTEVKGRTPRGSSQERLFVLRGRVPRDHGTCLPPDTHRGAGSATGAQALQQVQAHTPS